MSVIQVGDGYEGQVRAPLDLLILQLCPDMRLGMALYTGCIGAGCPFGQEKAPICVSGQLRRQRSHSLGSELRKRDFVQGTPAALLSVL